MVSEPNPPGLLYFLKVLSVGRGRGSAKHWEGGWAARQVANSFVQELVPFVDNNLF